MTSNMPIRKYMDEMDKVWRNSKPNYDQINAKYLREKTRSHPVESLEKIVEDLVKTWEMESSHKSDAKDWQSVDPDVFTLSVNGGEKAYLDKAIADGNYKICLEDCPLYDASAETSESSHKSFGDAFPAGFAWELLDLHSGPPTATFTWRHWGTFEGPFKGTPPTLEEIEIYGSCVVKVDNQLKVQSIEVYMDSNPMIAKLTNFRLAKGCPMGKEMCPCK